MTTAGNQEMLLKCWNVEMSCCHMSSAYVDHGTCWTTFVFMSMLKSHCLWLFVMLSCHAAICQVLMLITGTCWTTFVFMSMLRSHCLWLFVILSCHAVICQSVYVDHWDMLKNFCFHVQAENWVFIGENCNPFLAISSSSHNPHVCDMTSHRVGYQLKSKKIK